MEQLSPLALTTLQRVKDLLFDPSLYITVSASTNSSTSLTSVVIQTGKTLRVGQTISGGSIPSGTVITALGGTTITISNAATATVSGVAITVIDQPVSFDTLLMRMINSVTNYIHQECGVISFVLQTYINDTYTIEKSSQDELLLRNTPVFPLTITLAGCTVTSGSATVSGFTVPTGSTILPGMAVNGTGIPSGTTVVGILSSTSILLSEVATAGGTVTVNLYDPLHIIDFSWRAGTPSNPAWTEFIPDQYELLNPRIDPISGRIWFPSGIIKVYGVMPRVYGNMIRASYQAGYPVDWPNAGNGTTHMLPMDLTYLCENLVVRRFNRRQLAGMSAKGLEGATQSWRNEIDAEDLDVIGQYRKINF